MRGKQAPGGAFFIARIPGNGLPDIPLPITLETDR